MFLYCAVFLGEVRNFYYVVPFWDVILHAFSSLMLGFFGLMVISILNRIVDVIGALVAAITGYFSIKSDRLWFRPHLIEDEEK